MRTARGSRKGTDSRAVSCFSGAAAMGDPRDKLWRLIEELDWDDLQLLYEILTELLDATVAPVEQPHAEA